VSTAPPNAERPSADAGASGISPWILAFAVFFLVFACAATVIGLHDLVRRFRKAHTEFEILAMR